MIEATEKASPSAIGLGTLNLLTATVSLFVGAMNLRHGHTSFGVCWLLSGAMWLYTGIARIRASRRVRTSPPSNFP